MAYYLVTGGCGFIGSHLVESLTNDGHKVVVIDDLSTGLNEDILGDSQLVVGDIRDCDLINYFMARVDGCFHLAAVASVEKSREHWVECHTTNQTGTIAILEAAKKTCTPVVYASSAAVYGNNAETPLNEGAVTNPINAYGADKHGCELHAKIASMIHGVPTMGLRLFNVYGPRQDPLSPYSGVISIFCDRVLRGLDINIYGDGKQSRDFVHVLDAVNFLRHGMERVSLSPSVVNVCTGRATTIMQLVGTISHITDAEPKVNFLPARPGDILISIGCPKKSARELGIKANCDIYKGLQSILIKDSWISNTQNDGQGQVHARP